jgi:hypothetical protein
MLRPSLLGAFGAGLALASGISAAFPLERKQERILDFNSPSREGLVVADFDGDGLDEIVFGLSGLTSSLVALQRNDALLEVARAFPLHHAPVERLRLHRWDHPDGPRVVSLTSWNSGGASLQVTVHAGWPLREISRFSLPTSALASAVGVIDNTGAAQLLIGHADALRSHDPMTGALLWELPISAHALHVAGFGDASQPKVLVQGGAGGAQILDGSTRTTEWIYPNSFGVYLASGRIGPGGSPGFVGANDWTSFTVFQRSPWSAAWNFLRNDIDAIAVANLDNVGADEILLGDGQWGEFLVIDSQTQQIRLSVRSPGPTSGSIAALRTAPGPRLDLVHSTIPWGLSNPTVTYDGLAVGVYRSDNGQRLAGLPSENGAIGATLILSPDATGPRELMVAAWTGPGRIRSVDAMSGRDLWVSDVRDTSLANPFQLSPAFLLSARVAGLSNPQIVAAGSQWNAQVQVTVIDRATRAARTLIPAFPGPRFEQRRVDGASVIDFDGDGFDELALVTSGRNSAGSIRLQVLSLVDGSVLWESPTIGGSQSRALGLQVQPAATQDLLVVSLPNGLRAFGVESRLLEWTFAASLQRATYFPGAPQGAEWVLEAAGGEVSHFDATTLTVRRSYTLQEPSTGLAALGDAPFLLVGRRGQLDLLGADGTRIGSIDATLTTDAPAPIAVAPTSPGRYTVLVGSPNGFQVLEVTPEGLFRDGFESP